MRDDGTWQTKSHISEKERYQRYLASREWAVLKNLVRGRSKGVCEHCRSRPASQVHHSTYIRKYKEQLSDLQHVCADCHEYLSGKTEFDLSIYYCPPYPGDIYGDHLADHPRYSAYRDAWIALWFSYYDIEQNLEWWCNRDNFPIEAWIAGEIETESPTKWRIKEGLSRASQYCSGITEPY